ncbi:PREDICTED: uncharacterized protein LOC106539550 [Thamnophis sirtalis]|uniref:Uncharacterized protein LOC106539550 n=1 Tax=Thamnophis sirtalis TaxID=35019 RepID=A0A6I9XZA4_9SAUR|nr:PREDICTED: uncharacterized protein LOC106539550 [Thamnophis sirtalis]
MVKVMLVGASAKVFNAKGSPLKELTLSTRNWSSSRIFPSISEVPIPRSRKVVKVNRRVFFQSSPMEKNKPYSRWMSKKMGIGGLSTNPVKNCQVGFLPNNNAFSKLAPLAPLPILHLQSYGQHGSLDILPPQPNHHHLLDFTTAISKSVSEQARLVISAYAPGTYPTPFHWQSALAQYYKTRCLFYGGKEQRGRLVRPSVISRNDLDGYLRLCRLRSKVMEV